MFLKIVFIYLTQRESEHKQGEQQAEGEGEADSPLSRSLMGLHPWILGSCPEPIMTLNQLSHPGALMHDLNVNLKHPVYATGYKEDLKHFAI